MITEGYRGRQYQGRRGGSGPAIVDIAGWIRFARQIIEALGRDE